MASFNRKPEDRASCVEGAKLPPLKRNRRNGRSFDRPPMIMPT